MDATVGQLITEPWCSPGHVGYRQLANQCAHFANQGRASVSATAFSRPETAKPFAMPTNDGGRLHDGERLLPSYSELVLRTTAGSNYLDTFVAVTTGASASGLSFDESTLALFDNMIVLDWGDQFKLMQTLRLMRAP